MIKRNEFIPDYAVSPGEILEEELESRNLSRAALAERTGLADETINEIIEGKTPMTADIALKLESVFNLPAHFWSNLERHYQETKTRLGEKVQLQLELESLRD